MLHSVSISRLLLVSYLSWLCFLLHVCCHENKNPLTDPEKDGEHLHHPAEHKLHFDPNVPHEREHIQEHLDEILPTREENMTDEELQFHYFKLHDYNDDNLLDGSELLKALMHIHKEEKGGEETSTKPVDIGPMVVMVDDILKQHDRNRDGYVSYPEFKATASQR